MMQAKVNVRRKWQREGPRRAEDTPCKHFRKLGKNKEIRKSPSGRKLHFYIAFTGFFDVRNCFVLRWVGLGQWGRSRPGRFDLNEPIAKMVEVRNTLCRASWADMVRRGNLAPLQDKDQEKDPTQLLKMCKCVQRI